MRPPRPAAAVRRRARLLPALALAAAAAAPLAAAGEPALPAALADAVDLRGAYRAALCERPNVGTAVCADALRRFAGEPDAVLPPAADPARFRLLFVPGFLASCFPAADSFADVVAAARTQGFAAQVLAAEGRNDVAANARLLAAQVEALPDDGRRLILVGHSKGSVDALELVVARPDLARRVAAVLAVGGALQGSPLADLLRGAYRATFAVLPFPACAWGEGDPVADLSPARRRAWWARHGAALPVPVYSLVSVADVDRLSPALLLAHAYLSSLSPQNDGMVLARDQVGAPGRLLGVVNADHLTVAIPFPGGLPWTFTMTATPFPRPQAILAAIDVIAADLAATPASAILRP